MLTQEQINKIREQDKLPPVQSVSGANSVDRASDLQSFWANNQPKPTIADKISKFTGSIGDTFKEGAQNVVKDITNIPKNAKEAGGTTKGGKFLDKSLAILQGAGHVAGDIAGTAGGLIGDVIAPLVPKKISEKIGNVAQHVESKIDSIPGMTPEIKKSLGDVFNTLTLEGGKAAEAPLKAGANSTVDVIKNTGKSIVSKVGEKGSNMAEKSALKAVKATPEIMTKGERIQAINEGRQAPTKLGGVEYLPSETEKQAAKILKGKLTGNASKDVPKIKKEIAIRGKEAESYLDKNKKSVTAQEQSDMFKTFRDEAEKSFTDSELSAYDEQMKLFLKQIPGRGGYDTSNFYKALKSYESNVADHLPRGKEALLDPTGIANAKIRAASDIRKVVRDMIGNKNPEFKGKMFDLVSLYDAKYNVISKAEKIKGNKVTRFVKKHPIVTTAVLGEAGRKIITGEF